MTNLPPIYLRREPTTDSEMLSTAGKKDVVAYVSRDAATPIARWPWHYSTRPDKRYATVMLNCCKRKPIWLPDLNESEAT